MPRTADSFAALLRGCRHRARLSQEQLAARAELSERTVRNLEAGRVRSPRNDTVRLLADALELTEPERASWLATARGVNGLQAQPALPGSGGPAQQPGRLTVAVLTGDAQDASCPAMTCLIDQAGNIVLAGQCAHQVARLGRGCQCHDAAAALVRCVLACCHGDVLLQRSAASAQPHAPSGAAAACPAHEACARSRWEQWPNA
jgi:transcriptional regulator with XRE-family HTH domain